MLQRHRDKQENPSQEKQQLAAILLATNVEKTKLEQISNDVASAKQNLERLTDLESFLKPRIIELRGVVSELEQKKGGLVNLISREEGSLAQLRKEKQILLTENNERHQELFILRSELSKQKQEATQEVELACQELRAKKEALEQELSKILENIKKAALQQSALEEKIIVSQQEAARHHMTTVLTEIKISSLNKEAEEIKASIRLDQEAKDRLSEEKTQKINEGLRLDQIIEQKKKHITLLDKEIEDKKIASLSVVAREEGIKELEDQIRKLYKQAGLDIETQK